MIDRINIKRFRCFEKLEVKNSKIVNVFSGKNNVGRPHCWRQSFFLLETIIRNCLTSLTGSEA